MAIPGIVGTKADHARHSTPLGQACNRATQRFSISLRVNPTIAPAPLTDSCYAELTSTRDRGSIVWCTRVPTSLRLLAPATNGYT